MKTELDRLCDKRRVRIDARYGVDHVLDDEWKHDEWKRTAHPWTVTLRYHGRRLTVPFFMGSALDHEPTAADVLSCLLSDATSFENAGSFEEWAREYGFDTDSRKAERIYRELENLAPKVRRLLGDDFDTFARAEH